MQFQPVPNSPDLATLVNDGSVPYEMTASWNPALSQQAQAAQLAAFRANSAPLYDVVFSCEITAGSDLSLVSWQWTVVWFGGYRIFQPESLVRRRRQLDHLCWICQRRVRGQVVAAEVAEVGRHCTRRYVARAAQHRAHLAGVCQCLDRRQRLHRWPYHTFDFVNSAFRTAKSGARRVSHGWTRQYRLRFI